MIAGQRPCLHNRRTQFTKTLSFISGVTLTYTTCLVPYSHALPTLMPHTHTHSEHSVPHSRAQPVSTVLTRVLLFQVHSTLACCTSVQRSRLSHFTAGKHSFLVALITSRCGLCLRFMRFWPNQSVSLQTHHTDDVLVVQLTVQGLGQHVRGHLSGAKVSDL